MEPVRTYKEVLTEQRSALDAYVELAREADADDPKLVEATAKLRDLARELSAAISSGANPCQTCDRPPLGMLKTPAYFNGGIEVPAVYEVGCIFCPPQLVVNEERGVALIIEGKPQKVLRR